MENSERIFRAYDIRGIYGTTLTDEIAVYLPASFLRLVETNTVILGHDARVSSPKLAKILTDNFIQCGTNVIDIGLVSTDMFYFACGRYVVPGIMVTASHNPKEYNGFKMIKKPPHAVSIGNGMEEIEKGIRKQVTCEKNERGIVRDINVLQDFIEKLFTIVSKEGFGEYTVVVDTANGMTGPIWTMLEKVLPIKLILLNGEVDGTFPNHEPDPSKAENRVYAEEAVKKYHADIGFTFDADGDRCFFIDEKGQSLPSEFATALLAEYMLRDKKEKNTILYDVRSSWVIRDHITALGHTTVRERVGHAYIKKTMEEKKILFGGEVSGHFYFQNFYYSDSGTLAALMMLSLLSKKKKKLSAVIEGWKEKYFMTGELNFTVKDTALLIEKLNQVYHDGTVDRLDGFSVTYDDWHANIRASNTEPVIRLTVEAKTKDLLEQKKRDMIALITHFT